MKKQFITLMLIVVCVLCLCGCSQLSPETTEEYESSKGHFKITRNGKGQITEVILEKTKTPPSDDYFQLPKYTFEYSNDKLTKISGLRGEKVVCSTEYTYDDNNQLTLVKFNNLERQVENFSKQLSHWDNGNLKHELINFEVGNKTKENQYNESGYLIKSSCNIVHRDNYEIEYGADGTVLIARKYKYGKIYDIGEYEYNKSEDSYNYKIYYENNGKTLVDKDFRNVILDDKNYMTKYDWYENNNLFYSYELEYLSDDHDALVLKSFDANGDFYDLEVYPYNRYSFTYSVPNPV